MFALPLLAARGPRGEKFRCTHLHLISSPVQLIYDHNQVPILFKTVKNLATLDFEEFPDTSLKYKSGNFDVKDEPPSGRPVTDRHVSSYDIAEELRVDQITVLIHLKKAGYTKTSSCGSQENVQHPLSTDGGPSQMMRGLKRISICARRCGACACAAPPHRPSRGAVPAGRRRTGAPR
ncbi:hypothetical protein EVAR_96184_1 [Eumeta japonica]|uniref:Histone-lysine N-methyltransferase SETMAR n=1 Tax=Eumeta variegata TaxID=151549 RepID=A0A4C1VJL5_EUMVA|nr:hypothetical protein EVAR_96184_1 [Eumeta japonica]